MGAKGSVHRGVDTDHMECQVDAKMAVEKVGTLISLIGNVDKPQVLYQGTPEDVHKQVGYAVAAGINIMVPECAIPLSTPIENLKAIVEAAHEGFKANLTIINERGEF